MYVIIIYLWFCKFYLMLVVADWQYKKSLCKNVYKLIITINIRFTLVNYFQVFMWVHLVNFHFDNFTDDFLSVVPICACTLKGSKITVMYAENWIQLYVTNTLGV